MSKPIQITVGGGGYNPSVGGTQYNNPTLVGIDGYVVKAGYGTWGYNNYEVLSTGGFKLLNGLTFIQDEVFFFHPTGLNLQTTSASYTNGFNYSQVINAMFGRMGWRNSTLHNQPTLSVANQTATSGRYFNDFHALVTIPNIKAILDNSSISDNDLNAELEVLQKSVIMRCLNGAFSEKEYIEQVLLYNRLGQNDYTIGNEGQFVGYEINVANTFDKAVQIDSATLLFDSDKTFTLYLFKDGKKSHIWSQEVSVVGYEATVVNLNELILGYINPSTKGGRFYFGYFQDDLGSTKAIREQVECWSKTLIFSARPFYSKKKVGEIDFDRDSLNLPYEPIGINLQMSSFSDWTSMIVKRAHLFDELIGLTMAYNIVEKLIYTTSSNSTERILKDSLVQASAIQDLNGSAPLSETGSITGLSKRIEREMQRVKKALFLKPKTQIVSLC